MPRQLSPRHSLILPRGFQKPVNPVLDPTHPLSRGLVGCYLLGDSPARARDIAPAGNNGTYVASPTVPASASHHGGMAFTFNGSTQYVSVPNGASNTLTKFTVGGWARVTGGSGTPRALISKCDGATNFRNYYLAARAANVWGTYFTQGTGNFKGFDGSIAITTNAWTHVVTTYDGTTLRLFVNGAADGTTAPGGNPDTTNADLPRIGSVGIFAEGFVGDLEGFRIYDRALSVSEIYAWKAEPYAGIYSAGIFGVASAITGTIAVTESDDSIAAALNSTFNITFAITESADAIAANLTVAAVAGGASAHPYQPILTLGRMMGR